jgi:alpha-beta hydrolase superfamily lysophospholipase
MRARGRFLEFRLGASVNQVDEVIELAKSAAAAAVKPAGLSAAHFLVGQAYRARYDARGSLDDLTWSLRAMRQAVEEDPGQDRGMRRFLLANSLLEVVEMLEPGEAPASDHLKLIVGWLREARPLLSAKDAAMCQSSLGLALLQRARHFGSGKDLNAAIETLAAARDAATDDADRAACWGNLGKALMLYHNAAPSTETAMSIISAYDTAAAVSPEGDPNHSIHLRQQRMSREMFGVSAADPSPWVTLENGARVNLLTGEVRPPT